MEFLWTTISLYIITTEKRDLKEMLKLKLLQNMLHINTAALTSELEKLVQSSVLCYREAHLDFNVLKCKKKKKDKIGVHWERVKLNYVLKSQHKVVKFNRKVKRIVFILEAEHRKDIKNIYFIYIKFLYKYLLIYFKPQMAKKKNDFYFPQIQCILVLKVFI